MAAAAVKGRLSALATALGTALQAVLPGAAVSAVQEVDSTNAQLLNRARLGEASPCAMLALHQTAGRGRLGRAWHGDSDASLMVSLGVLLNPADWSGLSLAVGLAVAQALHADVTLKWPNDLWLGRGTSGRKLGGILIETVANSGGSPGSAGRWCVVGLGLNILPMVRGDLRTPSACLQELLPGADLAQTALAVVPAIASTLVQFERLGFAPLQAQFVQRDALLNVSLVLSDGGVGVGAGVGDDGALLVHTEAGVRRISSDEVSVRPS